MRTHYAWQGICLAAVLVVPDHSLRFHVTQPSPCDHGSTEPHHGALGQSIDSYSYARFREFLRPLRWDTLRGVDFAPRRGDCGHNCIFNRGATDKNERNDKDPPMVLVSIHPVCDAQDIALETLPRDGVLIGRVTYRGLLGGSQGQSVQRLGDASFNIGTGRFNKKDARDADHYVLLTRGQFVRPEYHAIWKLVALRPKPANNGEGDVVVVDSGLFRVCLPHPGTMPGEPLASFRSCAMAEEFHFMSLRRDVQTAVLGDPGQDTLAAQRRTFSLLIRGDSTALNRLRPRLRELFPNMPTSRDENDGDDEAASNGPFVSAFRFREPSRFFDYRYGELHPDAPMWFVCAGGCCSGEPW